MSTAGEHAVPVIPAGRSSAPVAAQAWPTRLQAWYALLVLTVALLVATIDRSILSLLVQPIKHDLHLSDTKMSVLIGGAFVFFYAFLGLPIARLADRNSRRLIIGLGMAFWSVMTAMCGIAHTFGQLFWARVGVGAGESSFAPATYSILTDSFPKEQMPRAMAVLSIGFVYGSGLALIVGGAVIQTISGRPDIILPVVGAIRSWQLVFFAVGAPGLILALIMASVHEPRRRGLLMGAAGGALSKPVALPVKTVLEFVGKDWKTFVPIFAAMGIKTLLSFGTAMWLPTFFIRSYHWSVPQIGYAQGLVSLIVAPLGLMAGSWLAEWYARKGYDDANMRVVQIATIAVLPCSLLYPLMPTASGALVLWAVNLFVACVGIGPGNAALQIITPNEMRGQVRAAFQFVFNVIGYALGPVFVALFTDYVFGADASLRYSLVAAAAIMGPIAILVTWYGLKPYARSVVRASAWA
ncbi:MAG TPA: MFS transporter [Steroidobacteraceae bacterium]